MISFDLNGKTAVVTGGAGSLGGAIADALVAAGARVAVVSRNLERVEAKAAALHEAGGTAMGLAADVLDRAALEHARSRIASEWGRLDILVNGAGGNRPGATIAPDQTFFDLSMEAFTVVNELNLHGAVLPSLVFGSLMAEQRAGVILNISSMAAQRPLTRVVGYAAAKAGIDNFTRWLAVEMAQKYGERFRVNAIAPGFFLGDQNRALLLDDDGNPTPRGQRVIDHTPMQRFGRPEELCGAALWLCSDAAAFVTGVVVPIDGGFSAYCGV